MVISMLLGICSFPFWQMPVGREWVSVLSIGIFGLIGQIFMTRAFQLEETSVLAPFKYMELIYALILGFLFFNETYRPLAFAGIAMIMTGMLLNVFAKNKGKKLELVRYKVQEDELRKKSSYWLDQQ